MNAESLLSKLASCSLVAALLLSSVEKGRAECEDLIAELGPVTKTSTNGNYTAAGTWIGGVVPGGNDVVEIPVGKTVTVNNTAPIAKTVIVRGTLKFSVSASSKLSVETLVVADGGTLIVGDYAAGQAIPGAYTATILIRDLPTITQDSARLARGLIASCEAVVRMNSALRRAPFVAFKGNLGPNTSGNIPTTAAVPADWRVNDEVVIPATVFTRRWDPSMPAFGSTRLQNELRTISAIGAAPDGIALNAALAYQHLRVDSTNGNIRVHAANLTRNIVIMSENPSVVDRFGHAMFMGNDVKLTGVLFQNMGRTVKRLTVSDPGAPTSNYNVPGGNRFTNPRGRYAVHFHKGGTATADLTALVSRCAVSGTPGWGFVNHSAKVDFTDNVAFDFDGAGFVAEDGDELGTFSGNIAIGGTGNGEFPNQRTVFGNEPRMDQGDMGFTGEGFWFQSPDVVVTGNIAAGCKGAGFLFWCGGRFDPGTGRYTARPLSRALPPGVTPRSWDYDGDGGGDAVVIEDLPLAGCSGNTAYGCLFGMKFRFVNHTNVSIFTDIRSGSLLLEEELIGARDALRARFPVRDCTLWNNLNGIHASYLTNTDFSNITIVAAAARMADPGAIEPPYSQDAGLGAIGIDFHHANTGNTLSNMTVTNYTTGLWRDDVQPFNVSPADTVFTGCRDNVASGAGNAKGYDWFFMVFASDNVPDNPQ